MSLFQCGLFFHITVTSAFTYTIHPQDHVDFPRHSSHLRLIPVVTSSTDSRRHIFDWFSILFKLDVCCILFLFFYPTTSRIMGSCQDSCFNNQSAKSLLNILASKPSTNLELLSDWSIDLNVLRMFGRWNMNERSHKVTPNRILLDVSVSRKI
jgi:hypothetical protein